jgi:hypothetical protein
VPVWRNPFESLRDVHLRNKIVAARLVFLIKRVNREVLFYIWRINLLTLSGRVRLFGFWLKNPLKLTRGFIHVFQILFIFLCQSAIELIGNSRHRRCHFLKTSIQERLFVEKKRKRELRSNRPWRIRQIVFLFGLIQFVYKILYLIELLCMLLGLLNLTQSQAHLVEIFLDIQELWIILLAKCLHHIWFIFSDRNVYEWFFILFRIPELANQNDLSF